MFKRLKEQVDIQKVKHSNVNLEELTKVEKELIFSDLLEDLLYEGDHILQKYNVDAYNTPIRTPEHPTKSHLVVVREGSRVEMIRFGEQGINGVDTYRTEEAKRKRDAFEKRFEGSISEGIFNAAYWAKKIKW